jgi:hypothetical protein
MSNMLKMLMDCLDKKLTPITQHLEKIKNESHPAPEWYKDLTFKDDLVPLSLEQPRWYNDPADTDD